MGYSASADDLRNLLALAGKLRTLALETFNMADRDLYLTAAAALEARAHRLATTLPQDWHDWESDSHQPVNLIV